MDYVDGKALKKAMDMHEKPKSLDEECIMLKDGTRINCDTQIFCSDRCPHGVFLCSAEECPEGCKWVVNGKQIP